MPKIKHLEAGALIGTTVVIRVRRMIDGYLIDGADGIFKASPGTNGLSASPYTQLPGIYYVDENRQKWDDGEYTIASYDDGGVLLGGPIQISLRGDEIIAPDDGIESLKDLSSELLIS